jgi:diguanylate cyclase (GGDEF)-like protein/PAS domain S-box-containing protein
MSNEIGKLSPKKVLIVDDHEENLYLLKSMLGGMGYSVGEAPNGRRALDMLKDGSWDLVVSDILMPVMDGYQLCRAIRTDTRLRDLRFVFYTATYVDQKDEEFALKLGADRFLRKPMDRKIFMENISELMEQVACEGNHPRPFIEGEEEQILKLYNERLVRKLEKKMLDLEKVQEALRKSEERYALAAQGANDGLWDWNLQSGIIYFSPRWKSMLGYPEDAVGSSPEEWFGCVHPDDLAGLKAELQAHWDNVKPHFEYEHRIRHADRTFRWVLTRGLAVRDSKDVPVRMAGSQTDITDRKRVEQQLLHDAFHDSLTNLPNRALFADRLRQSCERARRTEGYSFAVLHADLDRFKVINESLGHAEGDVVLKEAAERMLPCLRPGDTLARLSADEFLILLEDVKDASEATRIAARITAEMAHPFIVDTHELVLTISIGIVLSPREHGRPEDYLREADLVMRKAKARGRARMEMFDAALYEITVARLQLETALQRALEHRELDVYYQPVIDLESGRLAGLEALVRWRHPQRGVLLPADFLPIAEEAGLIVAIDRFVLTSACAQLKQWLRDFPTLTDLTLSVNFSSRQFSEPDLLAFVTGVLAETELEPRHLSIEITEGTLVESMADTQSALFRLQALGIRIYIDDFGTGYSSLSYLHHFPIDMLKIDRSFVEQISSAEAHVPIVQTIISLAHSLGMQTVAEGVENLEQIRNLKSLKCKQAQGFYFSEPVDAHQTETTILIPRSWL